MITLDVEPYEYLFEQSFRTSRENYRRRAGFHVSIQSNNIRGTGDVAPLHGWTESYARAKETLRKLEGRYNAWRPVFRFLQGDHLGPATRFGIHQAVVDWRGRYFGRPLFVELSGRARPTRVEASGVVGIGEPGDVLQQLQDEAEAGYSTVKIKLGSRSVERELDRISKILPKIPNEIDGIRLDANGSWNFSEATRILQTLNFESVDYLEQPLPAGASGMMEELPDTVRIGWDEEFTRVPCFGDILDSLVDVLVIKPVVLGGLDRALAWIDFARQSGLEPVISTALESLVGRRGIIHLAATRRLSPAGLGLSLRFSDSQPWPAVESGGSVSLPIGPGSGSPH